MDSTFPLRSSTEPSREDWNSLIFGAFRRSEIAFAVGDGNWQRFRIHLLGLSNRYKFNALRKYIDTPVLGISEQQKKIRVTNYVNSLRRGGLIP